MRDNRRVRRAGRRSRALLCAVAGAAVTLGATTPLVTAPAVNASTTMVPSATSIAPRATPQFVTVPAAARASHAGPATCTAPDGSTISYIHCYTPDQIRAAYGLSPLTPTTTDGAGQTIVLVDAYGTPTGAGDLAHFASTFAGPTPDYEAFYPLGTPNYGSTATKGNGQSGPSAAAGWAGEATLDIEWAYAIAPRAHIVLAATPPAETEGVQGLPNLMKATDSAITRYPAGTVFSMSFGTEEADFGGAAATQFAKFDQTFQRGLARHDTFFSSSGDAGSTGVGKQAKDSRVLPTTSVSYPNVSPYVTSVGGTQLQSGWTWQPTQDVPFLADGSFNPAYWGYTDGGSSQPVWNESWAGIATGGGVSTVYPRPAYQSGVLPSYGDHRLVPDLAWNAAVNGGVLTYETSFVTPGDEWGPVGGTSAASPQAAALTAIANAARAAKGKAGIGDLNKAIYAVGFPTASAFTDIVPHTYGTAPSGVLKDNRIWDTAADGSLTLDPIAGYPTTAGYDLTTGFGAPSAPGYVSALAARP